MRLVCSKRGLPHVFEGHPAGRGIVLERDIRLGAHARLHAKLLVFSGVGMMQRFWRVALGKSALGPRCLGAVTSLSRRHENPARGTCWLEVDPRYFCVIGLVQRHLCMNVICHEAVHAGWAYARRRARSWWDEAIRDNDEERVCYPAGLIAAAINRAVHEAGLYRRDQV